MAAHPAVARIIVQERGAVSYGSGTLVDVEGEFGLVVTNWHVVRDASGEVRVQFPSGFQSPAQIVKTDPDWDLAALSIARPGEIAPLPISATAPKPGDPLVIAGFGSGDYRAVSGRCTQYVSPGDKFPYEMVEISAEARQGDSGGPIFNERGELAGVLFGAGRGFTSGSYAGRVQQFLSTVLPGSPPASATTAIAAAPPITSPPVQPPVISQPPPQTTALHEESQEKSNGFEPLDLAPIAQVPTDSGSMVGDVFDEERIATIDVPRARNATEDVPYSDPNERLAARTTDRQTVALPSGDEFARERLRIGKIHTSLPPRTAQRGPDLNSAPPDQLLAAAWQKLGGDTLFDQGKSVLAIVGLLCLLVQFWRLNSRSEPAAVDE